jgi:AcrR family transcriptional regulator
MKDKRSITRSQIIDAASSCFAEFGYDKTTFDDVAKKAGISRALIYTYFKSKQEFFTQDHTYLFDYDKYILHMARN